MKFMITWHISPHNARAAAQEFLASGAPMPEGGTLLGRWHSAGSTRGFALVEANTLGPVATHMAQWHHLLEFEIYPVVEDEEAGAALASALD